MNVGVGRHRPRPIAGDHTEPPGQPAGLTSRRGLVRPARHPPTSCRMIRVNNPKHQGGSENVRIISRRMDQEERRIGPYEAATTRLAPLDWLEDRRLLSFDVHSAIGIGGDNLYSGGAANFSFNKIGSTAIDGQGDIFVAGEFAGSVNFDPQGGSQFNRMTTNGEFEMYVAKYSPQGAPVWVDVLGPPSGVPGSTSFPPDYANGLAVDKNGFVYVTGLFSEEVNFNPNPNQTAHDITPFNANLGLSDIFVLKLGPDGGYQTVNDYD
jgi:hypothetical protein